MIAPVFVDTNVLLYAVSTASAEVAKASVARDLLEADDLALSVQVLQEFYVNVTRKIARPISKASARQVVNSYSLWCIETTATELATAFRIEDDSRIGFWDALIIAAALKSGASQILSEDLNAGQRLAGIRIVNPFAKTTG